ncbi:MAG TPA: hypothetical protein PKV66_02540 [Candidatus Pelethenecus sp.]|nr:hypothetical protein [Candidatus Pelethenecus sp.]
MEITPWEIYTIFTKSVYENKLNFLEQGKLLSMLRKNSLYRDTVGEGINSWHEFLAQPEIGMSPTQANKLLNIYELFIKKLNYAEEEIIKIPIKTLNYLVKRKEEFEELGKDKQEEIIEQAKVLSFKDFKEAYFDQKNEDNKKGEVRTFTYVLMQKCDQTGNMTKVHAISSDELEMFVNKMKEYND